MKERQVSLIGAIVFIELLFLAHLFLEKKPEFTTLAIVLSALLAFGAFMSVFFAYRKIRKDSEQKKVWLLLSAGMLFWFVGELTTIYYVASGNASAVVFPSIEHVAWVIGYLFFGAALFTQLWHLSRAISRKGGIVEAGIGKLKESRIALMVAMFGSLIIALLVANFLLLPVMNSSFTIGQKALLVAYLLGDFGLIVISLTLLTILIGGELEAPFVLLASAMTINGLSDLGIVFAVLTGSQGVSASADLFYQLSYTSIFLAGLLMKEKLR